MLTVELKIIDTPHRYDSKCSFKCFYKMKPSKDNIIEVVPVLSTIIYVLMYKNVMLRCIIH